MATKPFFIGIDRAYAIIKKMFKTKYKPSGFTIVELLVVIVVIGILAAITIVSYTGINTRSIISLLQSDLSSNSRLLKMYSVEYGAFPSALDGNNCPSLPNADIKYCLKKSSDAVLAYGGSGQYFILRESKNGQVYQISEGGNIATQTAALDAPMATANTVTLIGSTTAVLGSNVISTGGSAITSLGICWGTTPAPTSNCQTDLPGGLSALPTPTIAAGNLPYSVMVSPDGKSVYATNGNTTTMSLYSRDIVTGALTAMAPATVAVSYPTAVVFAPDGTSVYVLNYSVSAGTISMFSRNISTGALTPLGTPTITTGTSAYGLDISSDGKSVYVNSRGTSNIYMYSRNLGTGALAALGTPTIGSGASAYGVSVSPDGTSVYSTNTNSNLVTMYSRNTSTGALTALATPTISTGAGSNPQGLVVSSDSKSLYTSNYLNGTVSMFSRNTSTGQLTALATPTIVSFSAPNSISISVDGTSVYVANLNSRITMYSRNTTTGALTALASTSVPTSDASYAVAVSPDGNSVYSANGGAANNISMFSRNTGFGAFTQSRTGLPANTTIYYRSFVTNASGTSYSADSTFTTLP